MQDINGSVIYYKMQVDITETLAMIERKRAEGSRITLFHVMVNSLLRMGVAHPDLNRFISGRRLYQRREMSLSFTYVTSNGGKADTFSRIVFTPDDTQDDVSKKILDTVEKARAVKPSGLKQKKDFLDIFASLPRFMIAFCIGIVRKLDYFGLFTKTIMSLLPTYCSVYAANLGYYGIDAPFHHLFDIGNASVFVTMGVAHKEHITTEDLKFELRDVVNFAFTIDERVISGGEAAAAVKMFKRFMEHPETERSEMVPTGSEADPVG
jgi:hypothetical protein